MPIKISKEFQMTKVKLNLARIVIDILFVIFKSVSSFGKKDFCVHQILFQAIHRISSDKLKQLKKKNLIKNWIEF